MNDVPGVLGTGFTLGTLMGMVRWNVFGQKNESARDHAVHPPRDESLSEVSETPPRLESFLSLGPNGFHRVAYTEWGDPQNPHVVVCLHGFTRNSRDFDVIASRLADQCRVVCMDAVGRGGSDWLERKEDYDYSLYLSDAAALLARITASYLEPTKGGAAVNRRAPVIDWIGTSMGGLVGMLLAAKPNAPIRRLVLNDVGPLVPWAALNRLRNMHMPLGVRFATLDEVEAHLRDIFASFGPLDDAGWKKVVRHSAWKLEDGKYMLAYDPGIMSGMNHARKGIEFGHNFLSGVDLWPVWDRVECATLALRGGVSDVLLPHIAHEMERRGPKARVVEFPDIGHAPWLVAEDQVATVQEFLLTS